MRTNNIQESSPDLPNASPSCSDSSKLSRILAVSAGFLETLLGLSQGLWISLGLDFNPPPTMDPLCDLEKVPRPLGRGDLWPSPKTQPQRVFEKYLTHRGLGRPVLPLTYEETRAKSEPIVAL